ncbi:hypothetical protein CW714_09040 [Methanophagales archaeon]|nr:MAG: hypothetical protein CW714_09040 [Methanophagales archaeon]
MEIEVYRRAPFKNRALCFGFPFSMKIAEELGIEPISEEEVVTGAGLIKVKRGEAWIKLKGKEGPFNVWISDFIDKVLLGVVVLESLGFDVDPATGTLKERPLLLY